MRARGWVLGKATSVSRVVFGSRRQDATCPRVIQLHLKGVSIPLSESRAGQVTIDRRESDQANDFRASCSIVEQSMCRPKGKKEGQHHDERACGDQTRFLATRERRFVHFDGTLHHDDMNDMEVRNSRSHESGIRLERDWYMAFSFLGSLWKAHNGKIPDMGGAARVACSAKV